MRTPTRRSALFGDLVAAAYDEAGRHSTDPADLARMAAEAVAVLLGRTGGPDRSRTTGPLLVVVPD
jgi:hypothetical protein